MPASVVATRSEPARSSGRSERYARRSAIAKGYGAAVTFSNVTRSPVFTWCVSLKPAFTSRT